MASIVVHGKWCLLLLWLLLHQTRAQPTGKNISSVPNSPDGGLSTFSSSNRVEFDAKDQIRLLFTPRNEELSSARSMELITVQNVTSSTTLGSRLRDEVWVVPLIIFASLNLIVMACFEGFVLVKMISARPSRRHFFLGQMLLLGLFLSSLVSFAFISPPNLISCTVVRLGVGLAYSFVFATLMVKLVFLISLNNGVYLPAAYHGLLLFFVVAVQVAIDVQWLVQRPPGLLFTRVGGNLVVSTCNTTFDDVVLSLVYVMFLLIFVVFLSIKSHGIRDNYRESMYIGLSVGCSLPLWVTWVALALVLRDGYEEPSLAFGLVINSTLTFIIMFVPKGRQLAALGKEGFYLEDQERDDHLSSISLPSIYTPSFYHLKPSQAHSHHPHKGVSYKSSVNTDRTLYQTHQVPRYPRDHLHSAYEYSNSYPYIDDSMYYSMVRTMRSNPNVHFVRNPMIY